MITGSNIQLSLSGKPILKGVSLSLQPGEVLALCGPNGAGKSTLLSCLAGEQVQCGHAVFYFDKAVSALTPQQLSQRRVVLEQSPSLTAEFTLAELIELGAPLELPPEALRNFKQEAINEFGFAADAQAFVSRLSGGQQHRAHLARVLLQLRANVWLGHECFLFLDEPTASLDIGYQIKILQLTRDLASSGVGVLLVLHDLNLAAAFADRVLLMRDGQIVHQGSPEKALTETKLSEIYETPIFVEQSQSGQFVIQPRLHEQPTIGRRSSDNRASQIIQTVKAP
ncbi:MAG: ATP-binding cassette domain-containing protein [Rhizobiaceae bacterium]|nr:ATP-binding cassette domain-containing protein [Rhizobiaceae bacterium]